MSTYQELLAQKAAIEAETARLNRQIAEARQVERTAVIVRIKTLLADNGMTVSDLVGLNELGDKTRTGKSGQGHSVVARRKVAVKFRHPLTGDSWTGRGLKPKWLTAALASGMTLDQLAI